MAERAPFSPQAVGWLVGLGFLAFFGALMVMVFDDPATSRTAGANPFSESAIGHRAFVETLERLDIPILVSRAESARRADGNLLIVAEPPPRADDARLETLLDAGRVLVVLPKWRGRPDPEKPRWVGYAEPIGEAAVERLLDGIAGGARVVRTTAPGAVRTNAVRVPADVAPYQLVRSDALFPLVSYDGGILLGEVRGRRNTLWVLSDPDVLNNHGLARGDNARFAVAVVEMLRPAGGAAVFDATALGFGREPSLWRALFEFPFVIATIMAAAAVAVLMWAAVGRFGAPRPPRAPFEAGKARLIANTAALLGAGGHAPELLARYFRASLRDVARRVHAPRHLDEAGLLAWLDRVAAARGVAGRASDLHRRAVGAPTAAGEARIARTAYAIYRWKREMIDGPDRHPGAR